MRSNPRRRTPESIQENSILLNRVRLILVSDTHGRIDPRIARLSADCDVAVHAGDIMADQVLKDLKPRSGQVYAVRGNNDLPRTFSNPRSLERLPDQWLLHLPGGVLCVEHGHRIRETADYHQRLRNKHGPHGARAIVYGHTHKLNCDTARSPWVLNPGAAGRVRTHGGPSCMILTARKRRWDVKCFRFEPDRP